MNAKNIIKLVVGIPAMWLIVNFIIGFVKAARDFKPCQYRTATTKCHRQAEDLTSVGWLCREHIMAPKQAVTTAIASSLGVPS